MTEEPEITYKDLVKRMVLDMELSKQNREILEYQSRIQKMFGRMEDVARGVEKLLNGRAIFQDMPISVEHEDWQPTMTTPKQGRVIMVELFEGHRFNMPRFTVGHYVQDTKTWYVLDAFGTGWKEVYTTAVTRWRYFPRR